MISPAHDRGTALPISPAARLLAAVAVAVLGGCSGTAREPLETGNEGALLGTTRESIATTCLTVQNAYVEDAPIVVDYTDPTKANTNYGQTQQMNTGFVGSDYRRLVLKLKPGEAGVPPGSVITSAVLNFRMIQSLGKHPVEVYQGTTLWDESTVTWNQLAAAPGGGVGEHLATVPTLGVPNNTTLSVTLPNALVETWMSPATNTGLVFDHPLSGRTIVASGEAPTVPPRPTLVVCYEPPAATCGDGVQNQGEDGVCNPGAPLAAGCGSDPCAGQICAADPFCCSTEWDLVCVSAVESVCGRPACRDCGDLACGGAENCGACPGDCGACLGCGNGIVAAPERCDDGNLIDGDGCSSLCEVECDITEVEPNGAPATANGPIAVGSSSAWECGAIGAAGDVDYFAFTLTATSEVDLETFDPTGATCKLVDTYLRIYDATGSVIATDDDAGLDRCSRISASTDAASRLRAGTYFVAVQNFAADRTLLPGYLLRLGATAVCGNGVIEGSEQCDDGNTGSGDGCNGDCAAEALAEGACANGKDEDGDGLIDCGDPDCQGSCAGFCAPGQTLIQVTATGMPRPIDAQSLLPVSTGGTVTRVAVALDITYPTDGDLTLALTSPEGALAQLAIHRGGLGQSFIGTVFDSSCPSPVAAGASPFTGCFAPDTHLGVFNGEPSLGDWRLDASSAGAAQGTLDAVVLSLCVIPPAATGEAVLLTPTGLARAMGGCQIYPSDNPWNTDISAYPVHSRSSEYMATIAEDFDSVHPGFGNPVGSAVTSTQPRVLVECTPGVAYCPTSDIYTNGAPTPMPIPPDAEIENLSTPTSDRHLMVLDTDECLLYELFHANRIKDSDGTIITTNDIGQIDGTWHWRADSGAIYDLKTNALRPSRVPASTASGLPFFAGLVRYEEVASGAVNHALAFVVPRTQLGFIAPATTYASLAADPLNPAYPPMGLRLRLKASYDTSAFYGQGRVVVEAMKRYGLFVKDNGEAGIYPAGSTGLQSTWKFSADLNEQLHRIPVTAFEVVDTGPIQY